MCKSVSVCNNCKINNKVFRIESGNYICENCFNEKYFECDNCHKVFHNSIENIFDGNIFCVECSK